MSSAKRIEARADSVRAEVDFLRPVSGRAFSYAYEPSASEPPETVAFEAHSVEIHNARTALPPLTLDAEGAALIDFSTRLTNYDDDSLLRSLYYPEAAAAIKAHTGASRVVVFDHNVRRGLALPVAPGQTHRGRPVLHAHTDYTGSSAVNRLRGLLGDEAESLLVHRFMQVNLWRPIRGPLRDAPLAVCDASSIGATALTAVDLLYPGRRGEIYYLSHEPTQRWYFAPDMQPDEAWLLKNFDSATGSSARFAAHSAFIDPTPHANVLPRESIEVRAFALFDR
jgi:hypothetical protein